jgi:hypothetical protein
MGTEPKNVLIVILMIAGIALSWIGVKTLLDKSPDIERDSKLDKWLFSSHTRYFLGRYYAGGQLLMAGLFCFVAAFIVYIAK